VILLGSFDGSVTQADRDAYLKQAAAISGGRGDQVQGGSDRLSFVQHAPDAQQTMTVSAMQQALKDIGFFPGGKVDGICGYRTRAAMRLFQEYVRSVEKLPCVPDGRFGPSTQQHLQRWKNNGVVSQWADTIDRWQKGTLGQTEYTEWLSLLGKVKEKYLASPSEMLRLVNAFPRKTDTRKVADWDFGPGVIHLVGVRRSEKTNKFDDLFALLIKGLVFKFQGSTDPGATSNPLGAPFLVQGQHDYFFGWHKSQHLAVRPTDKGVLVVRSKGDFRLDDADVSKGLEANSTIHIHWGGKGLTRDVNKWSEGCQVISGSAYLGPNNERVDCSSFVATNNDEVESDPSKTRGAYNLLADLVLGLGSDLSGNTVRYVLLTEQDLALATPLIADARTKASVLLG
jgi:putative peptidoglycan binding protein